MKYGELTFGQEVVAKAFLTPVSSITYDAVSPHDPKTFWKTRKGLYVWGEFAKRILPYAKKVKDLPETTGTFYDLAQSAYDRVITANLPEGYAFDDSELCTRLAFMLEKQANGEKGDLLTDGRISLFYTTSGFVVGVRWYADDREWNVRAWHLDDAQWLADDRVFSRT